MKFIDFGDLVEVTYDDESVELVSKEEAHRLGYKECKKLKTVYAIEYNDCTYNIRQFSILSGLTEDFITKYYNLGLHTGEELISAHKKMLENTIISIQYNNKLYSAEAFSRETGITAAFAAKQYRVGIHDGKQILALYKKMKERKIELSIPYQGHYYNASQLQEKIGINRQVITDYYNKGICTGEEIIAAHKVAPCRQPLQIPYAGQMYNGAQLSDKLNIERTYIHSAYKRGLRTGEEILEAYTISQNKPNISIPYKGAMYNYTQLSKRLNIGISVIRKLHKSGLRTGEEILTTYKKTYRGTIQIPYKNKFYTCEQLSEKLGIGRNTVRRYYAKGLSTGEEMITYYNRNKH